MGDYENGEGAGSVSIVSSVYRNLPPPRADFAPRMMECVSNAFNAVGTSSIMEDYIYFRLSLGINEIISSPLKFMEALKDIFGEAGAAVYEYQLVKQISKDFHLIRSESQLPADRRGLGELLRAAISAAMTAP